VRFHQYEPLRDLALHLTGGNKDQVMVESEMHIDTQVPIVSANYMVEGSTTHNKTPIEWLEAAVRATYDKVTRYGPAAGIVWAHSASDLEGRAYFLNAGSLLRQGQGDPKLALTTAIQRCQGKLPKPFAMGFYIYGNMPLVDEKARGVLISTIYPDSGEFKVLVVDKDQKLTVTQAEKEMTRLVEAKSGEGSKLDEAVINAAKAAMAYEEPEEEETPKEE
jgi:hypothetical protein